MRKKEANAKARVKYGPNWYDNPEGMAYRDSLLGRAPRKSRAPRVGPKARKVAWLAAQTSWPVTIGNLRLTSGSPSHAVFTGDSLSFYADKKGTKWTVSYQLDDDLYPEDIASVGSPGQAVAEIKKALVHVGREPKQGFLTKLGIGKAPKAWQGTYTVMFDIWEDESPSAMFEMKNPHRSPDQSRIQQVVPT